MRRWRKCDLSKRDWDHITEIPVQFRRTTKHHTTFSISSCYQFDSILCTKSNVDRNHPFHLSRANVVFHVSNKHNSSISHKKKHISVFIHIVPLLFFRPSKIVILEPDTASHSLTIVSIGYLSDWSTNTQVLLTFIHSYRSREAQIWIQRTWAVLHDPHNKLQTNSWVIVCHANRHSLLQLLGLLVDKNAFVYSLSICSTTDCTNYSLVMDTHTGFIKWIFPQFTSAR